MSPLADHQARERIRKDLDATLLIEAAAGTGKTSELVARIVALIREGRAPIDGILAVTFTDKAAGEMKLRVREQLEHALRTAPDAARRDRLGAALAQLEGAQIGTIHAVCADLLKEWPIEAGVDPLFEVASQEVAERLFDQAFDAWFVAALGDPPEGVRRLLRRRSRGRDAEGPRELLRSAGWDLCEHRDFDAPFRRDGFDRAAGLRAVMDQLQHLAALAPRAQRPEDWLAKSIAELHRFAADVQRRQELRGPDDDGLEAELRELSYARHFRWRGKGRFFCEGVEREQVTAQREQFLTQLKAFLRDADADLAACLREELRPLVAGYEERKARQGCLDFLDLLGCANQLISGNPAVLAELRARVRHVLVDEFQDTDPLQAELLRAIAGDRPGAFFAVGDPKQSIYRFRRADLTFYQDEKKTFLARGAEVLNLTTSFRGAPAIQQAINAAFALQMKGQPGQAEYVPLTPFRAAEQSQPAVIALPAPRLFGDRGWFAKFRVEESYPDAVGAFVDWLLTKSGWTVTEREGRVPVEARHVCLLFKRMQSWGGDLTRAYVQALEARNVRHVLVGGKSYHAREEVLALRNAAQAIERPDDELAVFATLRGPLFALGDDALLVFRGHYKRLHPLKPLGPPPATPECQKECDDVAQALSVLARLHRGRNLRPIADTLAQLLRETRAHAGLAIWPSGEQALANALRVLDLARRFEAAGATSFRAFVDRLEAEEERGDAGEAPAVEEGAEGVRIMSAHRAKGLEFPVVILCDPTAPPAPRNPSRHVETERRLWAMPLAGCSPRELEERREEALDRDRAETVRLAYVAATRARDLLVVPLVAHQENESWLDVLLPAVQPRPELRRKPSPAPGCPAFSSGSVVLDAPDDPRFSLAIAPGLHVPEVGEHGVVVWDPRALELDKEAQGGLRREALLEQDQAGAATAGILAHQAWADGRSAAQAAGGAPSQRVVTATALGLLAEAVGSPAPLVRLESVEGRDAARPGGKRFGTLVHALLAEAELTSTPETLRRLAQAQGRLIGATEAEVTAAAAATGRALAHPLLARAARSDDCRREAPLWVRADDGALVEGVADLAFREDGRWVVIDFKTDARPEAHAGYATQLSLYVKAISQATGEPAEGVLLAV